MYNSKLVSNFANIIDELLSWAACVKGKKQDGGGEVVVSKDGVHDSLKGDDNLYGGSELQQHGNSGLVKDPDQCGAAKLTTTNEILPGSSGLATDHAQKAADWLFQHGDRGLVQDPVQCGSTKLTTSTTANEILHGGSGLATEHAQNSADWLLQNGDSGLVKDPIQSTKPTTTTTMNEILHGSSGLVTDHAQTGADWLAINQDNQGKAASF